MVLLGGLEIVAAGYLLNEFNDSKVKERERRKHGRRDSKRHDHHNHDDRYDSPSPPRRHDRPSKPSHAGSLQPPNVGPARPSSAPPMPMPGGNQWQAGPPLMGPQPQGYFRPGQNQQQGFPQPFPGAMPPQVQSQYQSNPAPPNYYYQQPPPQSHEMPGSLPQPGNIPRPQTFGQSSGYTANMSGPPSQSYAQPTRPNHANTFPHNAIPQSQQQNPPRPGNLQSSNSMPVPPKANNIYPLPPGTYIDTKTGRISHNLYPADHPMARGVDIMPLDDSDLQYAKTQNEDLQRDFSHQRRRGSADSDDLAYGRDYARRRRRSDDW